MGHSILADCLEIVHEDDGSFLCFLTVLFGKCIYSLLDLLYLGLVFDLGEVEGFDGF